MDHFKDRCHLKYHFSLDNKAGRAFYSAMVKARKFVIVEQFKDMPKETDLQIVEEELKPLQDGGELIIL